MAQPGFQAQTARIQIVAQRDALNFLDIQSGALPEPCSPLDVYRAASVPMRRLTWAFWVRDAISGLFGVAPIRGFCGDVPNALRVGDMLDFFTVEGISETQLVLTARDRHLDVMTCIVSADQTLTITSSVVTHNLFGRAYMLVVGPAHRVIVRRLLRKLAQDQLT
ncbi:MAG: DUF2867 domain-containing protein [Pelagimonas sp.]|jgi:hypothetical protein|nr:DUF2867 domain-containing protein [Pelagimonas sp.]